MDATLDYNNANAAQRPAAKPRRQPFNFRLIGLILVIAIPFGWIAWSVLDQRTIVNRGDYFDVDLKAMGNFPFDAKRDSSAVIPKEVLALNGKRVRFEGEMYAPDQARSEVKQFQLVYSIAECCLGGPPKVQERVFAFVPDDKRVPNYTGGQVTVMGTLHIDVKQQNGETVSVFTMDVEDVQSRT